MNVQSNAMYGIESTDGSNTVEVIRLGVNMDE